MEVSDETNALSENSFVVNNDDEASVESDGNDFEAAMKVRKNLSETFDRHASVAEKIARLESRNAALIASASVLSTRIGIPAVSSALSVSLRIRPPFSGKSVISGANNNEELFNDTIEILHNNNAMEGYPTTIRTHPPSNSNAKKVLRDNATNGGIKEYTFHRVFSKENSQHEVYSTIAAPMVHGLFTSSDSKGESALLFAYGVTNAGKTFTIMGDSNPNHQSQWGIIPRALQDILSRLAGTNLQLSMSFMEIYNENVYDLLSETNPSFVPFLKPSSLKIRESQDGEIFVKDLTKHRVANVEQGLQLALQAKNKRHTSSNNINEDSSRSHCICQLELNPIAFNCAEIPSSENSKTTKFWIVDLAGSERTKRTGGVRQKEATQINASLMTLMRCLTAMRENQVSNKGVVPFRESKLTHLFMGHLTGPGASRTSMIVNVNPAACDFDETQHVLGYAVVAKNVQVQHCPQKRGAQSDYDINGHRKQSALIRMLQKYSPKVLGKRKAVDVDDREIKRLDSKDERVIKRVDSKSNILSHGNQRSNVPNQSLEDKFRKEINSLKLSLSIAEAEISSLRLTCDVQAQELAQIEEQIRAEVSEEMEVHFKSTREDYDMIIENLQHQVKNNPVGMRSERKMKMDKAEKMIEELVDKVEECEEEMVRMRLAHEEELEKLKAQHKADLKSLESQVLEFKHRLSAKTEVLELEDKSLANSHSLSSQNDILDGTEDDGTRQECVSIHKERETNVSKVGHDMPQLNKTEETCFHEDDIALRRKKNSENEEELASKKVLTINNETCERNTLNGNLLISANSDSDSLEVTEDESNRQEVRKNAENEEITGRPIRITRSRSSQMDSDSSVDRVSLKSNRVPFGSISDNSDDLYLFPKKPTPIIDGAFSRPSGRPPRGREWDAERGAWRLSVSTSNQSLS
jgi:Kinesin motor domain